MILIVSNKLKTAQSLQNNFSYIGLLAHAVKPAEIKSEISPRYRAGIIINPEEMADAQGFLCAMRSYNRDLPVFAITDTATPCKFTGVFPISATASKIASVIMSGEEEINAVGRYRLAGLDLSPALGANYYFFTQFNLTHSEAMIVRFLIRAYPSLTKIKDILKYSFRATRMPEPSSVRTHISNINKKFREKFSRPLIVSSPGDGYTILTPEYAQSSEKAMKILEAIEN